MAFINEWLEKEDRVEYDIPEYGKYTPTKWTIDKERRRFDVFIWLILLNFYITNIRIYLTIHYYRILILRFDPSMNIEGYFYVHREHFYGL